MALAPPRKGKLKHSSRMSPREHKRHRMPNNTNEIWKMTPTRPTPPTHTHGGSLIRSSNKQGKKLALEGYETPRVSSVFFPDGCHVCTPCPIHTLCISLFYLLSILIDHCPSTFAGGIFFPNTFLLFLFHIPVFSSIVHSKHKFQRPWEIQVKKDRPHAL